jgi:uncharacterized membrane protein required for colicin V production
VGELLPLDAVAAALLGLALLRGLWIGAVREAFSLAGLAAAAFAVRAWRAPLADWLVAHAPFSLAEWTAQAVAVIGLGAATLLAVGWLGRLAFRGVREAGLRLADRVLGALLGALEGAAVVAVLVLGLIALLGREDEALAGTRSLAAFEWAEARLGDEPTGAARER